MTSEQAVQIRNHLINELNRNGFSDVVSEVNTRYEEDYEEENFQRSSIYLLIFFLTESISVLDSLSNKNYNRLIDRFNEYSTGQSHVEDITVELISEGEVTSYNLRDLPNYGEIAIAFQEILDEVLNDN